MHIWLQGFIITDCLW